MEIRKDTGWMIDQIESDTRSALEKIEMKSLQINMAYNETFYYHEIMIIFYKHQRWASVQVCKG